MFAGKQITICVGWPGTVLLGGPPTNGNAFEAGVGHEPGKVWGSHSLILTEEPDGPEPEGMSSARRSRGREFKTALKKKRNRVLR